MIQSIQAEDLMTMRRRPVAQSTDCVRTKQGYARGLHAFEVTVYILTNFPVKSNLCRIFQGDLSYLQPPECRKKLLMTEFATEKKAVQNFAYVWGWQVMDFAVSGDGQFRTGIIFSALSILIP